MNVAVVHYHLADGGVSSVIRASRAMMAAAGVRQVVFTGGESTDEWHRTVDGLGYGVPETPAAALLARLLDAVREAFGAEPDLWHFHNHSLGKNPRFSEMVALLAESGARLLMQIHDLAEDGRPGNACHLGDRRRLYPHGPRVHYAFLNVRDLQRFTAAGLPVDHAHLLPNPVVAQPVARRGADPLRMLAPIRGIRRKNLGELVLLAALAPDGCRAAVTRAPRDPTARIFHDAWSHFAGEAGIPIDFAVVDRISPQAGTGCSLHDWLAHSSHIVTTSVAEGFGLPLHEAAGWGRPLLGRALPHIVVDHAGSLYDQLLVPADWIDDDMSGRLVSRAVAETHAAWGRATPPAAHDDVLNAMRHGGLIDFAKLPEILQRMAILRALQDGGAGEIQVRIGERLLPARVWLERAMSDIAAAPAPRQDHPQALMAVYQKLCGPRVMAETAYLDAERILDACLVADNFHFLTSPVKSGRAGGFRAVIFDVYGTLLDAAAGGVKPDPEADPRLREVIRSHGHEPPESPSSGLHEAVRRHHAASGHAFPEVDLRELWREVLGLPADHDTRELVIDSEAAWHPARLMPGAGSFLRQLVAEEIPLGLLSNAQCNTLHDLGRAAAWFEPDLCILSYRHGMAKPAAVLFDLLLERLAARGIAPGDVLLVGNDPLHDIAPATAAGMRTALFTGHPGSLRPGNQTADHIFSDWSGLSAFMGLAERQ